MKKRHLAFSSCHTQAIKTGIFSNDASQMIDMVPKPQIIVFELCHIPNAIKRREIIMIASLVPYAKLSYRCQHTYIHIYT